MATVAPTQLEFYDTPSGKLVKAMAVELSPGVHTIVDPNIIPPDALPQYGMCRFVRQPNGDYRAIAVTHGALVKLTTDIGTRLGFRSEGKGIYESIKRLCWAGFIRHKRLTHDSYYLDLHSLYKFLRRTENPGFWSKERIARYLDARDGPLPDPDNEYWNPEKL